jgi:hypothetical protein
MPQHLRKLEVEMVSLVDRAAVRDPSNPSEPQRFVLFKREGGGPTKIHKEDQMTEAELRAVIEKVEAERDELAKQVRKLEKQARKSADGEKVLIDKSQLAPEIRKALEKAETEREELRKQAQKAERLAKDERDRRIEREFVAKAEAEYAHVGGDAAEFGRLLKSASEKLSGDEFAQLETQLKAANERISATLYKEAGVSGDPVPGATSVHADKLEKRAQELRKADRSLSAYEAMHLAMTEDREAQAAYLATIR